MQAEGSHKCRGPRVDNMCLRIRRNGPSQQAGHREVYDRERPDHMAVEVYENSKEQSPHAREVWADEPQEKGRLAPGIVEILTG